MWTRGAQTLCNKRLYRNTKSYLYYMFILTDILRCDVCGFIFCSYKTGKYCKQLVCPSKCIHKRVV